MTENTRKALQDCASTSNAVFDALEAQGHQAWLVGGCVRDILRGEKPKDIDLATDATPEEAWAAYKAAGLKVLETGLQHGTLTAIANNEPFEITTLRTESGHDGRHADVAWTKSIENDLMRRDLTINAIAARRDGSLIDPFGGVSDLQSNKVRFVGNADERIKEDHLRILRFFRFHSRFAGNGPIDQDAELAIKNGASGLAKISVERVWMEMSKIIVHPAAAHSTEKMARLGVFEAINLPTGNSARLQKALDSGVDNPAIAIGLYFEQNTQSPGFKWSHNDEKAFQFSNKNHQYGFEQAKYDLFKQVPREHVEQVSLFNGFKMDGFTTPVFPVKGKDLIEQGMQPGLEMGNTLKRLEEKWVASDYQSTHEELITSMKAEKARANAFHASQAMGRGM
jgi:tRNA nucleotidyltransferase/poly(A) polymerase